MNANEPQEITKELIKIANDYGYWWDSGQWSKKEIAGFDKQVSKGWLVKVKALWPDFTKGQHEAICYINVASTLPRDRSKQSNFFVQPAPFPTKDNGDHEYFEDSEILIFRNHGEDFWHCLMKDGGGYRVLCREHDGSVVLERTRRLRQETLTGKAA